MTFGCSLDTTAKVITGGVVALLLAVPLFIIHREGWVGAAQIAGGTSVAIIVLSFLWAPRSYSLDGATLNIHRPIGTRAVPISTIKSVRRPEAGEMSGPFLRVFGNGGLFGYYGIYSGSGLGRHNWYVTDRGKFVLVETEGRVLVLSPESPEAFVEAVSGRLRA